MQPRAYYNEIDLYCAEWLYNLQKENLIAPGDIDTRPIQDVCPNDLKGYSQHHFFAGIGGWSYALRLAGWSDDRQVWTGSCPCQPFSLAGKRGGFADDRHLWPYWQWLIRIGEPATVLGEQVASASQWLGLVRSDLEALGYAVGAMPVEAASAGADHKRDRYWFVGCLENASRSVGVDVGTEPHRLQSGFADASGKSNLADDDDDERPQGRGVLPERPDQRAARQNGMADANSSGDGDWVRLPFGQRSRLPDSPRSGRSQSDAQEYEWVIGADGKARRVKPGVRLLAHGVPARVPKLRALGNAIDWRPAAAFIQSVMDILDKK